MALEISNLSTEYIRVLVSATKAGVAADPTGDTVQFAFPAVGTAPTVWYAGTWETVTNAVTNVKTYYARCLVGPSGGTVSLAAGKYSIHVKVTDAPEIPVLYAGNLLIS